MTKRKLPVGVQSFEKVREDGYIYVDKPRYIGNLAEGGSSYFLSRPRRFGKSLLVSTMEAYFRGQKELFSGLAIEELEKSCGENAWTEYPVITFSLSVGEYNVENGLKDRLSSGLDQYASEYGLDGENALTWETLPVRFQELIENFRPESTNPIPLFYQTG